MNTCTHELAFPQAPAENVTLGRTRIDWGVCAWLTLGNPRQKRGCLEWNGVCVGVLGLTFTA